ncbi:LytTR family transcriptional regulator [Clostridium botulinum]|uniref:Stage 0 sporulation protein A homolog n=1 Tax=Clostridium botulinum C/D str. DC5 TaxID=1443128 RepID=A0A0A0IBZ6_CLOBO|nr:LytTR family DNA-binding domain-containing protein [Clostridium botulinum]KGM98058.1 LytTR family transcriptional regulator [Clostridium botulinum C/D str. DC5]KOC52362.1 LytTR family transcriptional regulator [Clostridium botulinum]KOC53226.1 LytTR family transcriptional regulator [Clostridium botulinum]MCD3235362.1 response regulator transcription factor [Clostridium botulinum D/C]MCD3241286.1 response regulator transcription factor [Clostridium botulinum D/C]
MNCIVVDDEYPAREELKFFINAASKITIDGEFDDSIEALKYIQNNKPDIIFLDISMPKLDGMALAHIINDLDKKIVVIFITAYKEHALEAFEIEAFDYILKPYSEERIITTLKRLENLKNQSVENCIKNKIALKKNQKLRVINISEICYCEADEKRTLIFTKSDKYIENCSISDFYKKLPKNIFFKTHRSYIVNIDKITEIIPWFNNTCMIKLKDLDEQIPVSRNNLNSFKNLMNI